MCKMTHSYCAYFSFAVGNREIQTILSSSAAFASSGTTNNASRVTLGESNICQHP